MSLEEETSFLVCNNDLQGLFPKAKKKTACLGSFYFPITPIVSLLQLPEAIPGTSGRSSGKGGWQSRRNGVQSMTEIEA